MENFLRGRGMSDADIEQLNKDKEINAQLNAQTKVHKTRDGDRLRAVKFCTLVQDNISLNYYTYESEVDGEVILLMTDDEMSKYVPKYGDRIALLAFLKSTSNSEHGIDRKRMLADSILDGINLSAKKSRHRGCGMSEHETRSLIQHGNQHAKKKERRVEVGWINYDTNTNQYKQVKAPKGGGVRHYTFDGSTRMSTVLDAAKKVFFDEETGTSQRGNLNAFTFEIFDSNRKQIDDNCTVAELYERTKVKILRVYMATKKKNQTADPNENGDSDVDFVDTDTPTISFRRTGPRLSRPRTMSTPQDSSNTGASIQTTPNGDEAPSILDHAASSENPGLLSTSLAQTSTVDPVFDTSLISLPSSTNDPLVQTVPVTSLEDQASPTAVLSGSQDMQFDLFDFHLDGGPSELTLEAILKWWQKRSIVPVDEPSLLLINRYDILKSTLRVVRRESFNFCCPFKINFSGEDGDDLGGPTREFLRLLITEVCEGIFQGPDRKKFFHHDLEKLSKGTYEISGRLVAFSLLHGGPGIPVLHPVSYEILMQGEVGMEMGLPAVEDCIFDFETREKLVSLQNAVSQAEYENVIDDLSEWCLEQSLPIANFRGVSEKGRLLDILKKNEIFYRVQSEIVQFREGLNKVGGLLDTIRLAPPALMPLFVSSNRSLRFGDIRALYKVDWSPDGSNDRIKEQKALYCLEAFLADCEGGSTDVKLEEVLSFWTGATSIPPLGFQKSLEISFGSTKQLPTAHTCAMVLTIWRGFEDPDEFEEAMTKSIRWAGGFHLV